jgi:hypothetical protein
MRQREKAAEIEIVREDDEFVPRRLPHDPLVRRVRRTYSGPMDRLKTLVAECPHSPHKAGLDRPAFLVSFPPRDACTTLGKDNRNENGHPNAKSNLCHLHSLSRRF